MYRKYFDQTFEEIFSKFGNDRIISLISNAAWSVLALFQIGCSTHVSKSAVLFLKNNVRLCFTWPEVRIIIRMVGCKMQSNSRTFTVLRAIIRSTCQLRKL